MKTLGLIGGTTWVSTVDYYRILNRLVNERLGGLNSAKILLYSVNFEEFRPPDTPEGWENVTQRVIAIARNLETGGAEGLVLCANTLHKIADRVQEQIGIPIIHIAEATAAEISKKQLNKVALLGTKFTMQEPFYHDKLSARGIETLIPEQATACIFTTQYSMKWRWRFSSRRRSRAFSILLRSCSNAAHRQLYSAAPKFRF